MDSLILALFFSLSPHYLAPSTKAHTLAKQLVSIEKQFNLPQHLLGAVVLAESGGRKIIRRNVGLNREGCDVGEAQVHVRKCFKEKVNRLLVLENNLKEAARILLISKRICSQKRFKACKRSEFALYNANSNTWYQRVETIWNQIKQTKVLAQYVEGLADGKI